MRNPLPGRDKCRTLLGSMKIKQTILAVALMIATVGGSMTTVSPALAAQCGTTSDNKPVQTSIIDCQADNKSGKVSDNAIWKLLLMTLNIMAAGVGILAVAGISYAAVLYVTAADSAEQVKKSKTMITNVVIGIIAFALMYALLNFLIPGGVFA